MFTDYIILDGYKYSTLAKTWQPVSPKPMTVRQLANGDLDVTYGRKCYKVWEGEIVAPVEDIRPDYGRSSDIETSLGKMETVDFTDHYGSTYQVHVQFSRPRSMTNVWDSPSNKFYYQVRLIANA